MSGSISTTPAPNNIIARIVYAIVGSAMESEESWDWSFKTFLRVKPQLHTDSTISEAYRERTDDEDGSGGEESELLQFHYAREEDVNGEAAQRIELEVPLSAEPGLIHNNPSGFIPFHFNEIFDPAAGQDAVFATVQDMLTDCFNGINCTVMAYGQTGTGTYWMLVYFIFSHTDSVDMNRQNVFHFWWRFLCSERAHSSWH